MKELSSSIKENLFNMYGLKTIKHIIVFESDDWGSIRMPSKETYNKCLKNGYQVDKNIFSKYDSLASEDDLNLLFDLLLSFKDLKGNHPIITANCLVANPNFEFIRETNYTKYHYELITDTFQKYPNHSNCFKLWNEGIKENIFFPQSHGREHLNVKRFMDDVKSGDRDIRFAIDYEMPGIFKKNDVSDGNNYVVTLEHKTDLDREEKSKIIMEGLDIFNHLFKYPSESFIPPNYTWHPFLEKNLNDKGVKYIQGTRFQNIPKGNYSGFKKKLHYFGEKNKYGQLYLPRNVFFEPTLSVGRDSVSSALKSINTAFRWGKPAVISTHRINFVGFIDQKNRDANLYKFRELLEKVIKTWPDVEFISTMELGRLISKSKITK